MDFRMKHQSILVGSLMLSGCASLEAYSFGKIDPLPVAPDAPAAWAAAGVAGQAEEGDWLSGFNDPVMSELVDEALLNNYSLEAQLATVQAASADLRAQRGSLLPFISGSLSTDARRTVFEGPDGDAVSNESSSFGLGINASWEADLWGRLAAGVDLSEADLLLARTDLASASGLETERGIVTNRLLETSAPNVYAMGDCAEVNGHVLVYVAPLMAAAKALGKTLAGEPTEVMYPAMPVTIKTPACPVVVSPPDGGTERSGTQPDFFMQCQKNSKPGATRDAPVQRPAATVSECLS